VKVNLVREVQRVKRVREVRLLGPLELRGLKAHRVDRE
jgi:hypothetical protein